MDRSDKMRLYTQAGFYLYTEERCRFGKGGQMLPLEEAPDDGLCRVIVDYHSADQAVSSVEEWLSLLRRPYGYPTMVAMAAAELCGQAGSLWSAGEIKTRLPEGAMLEASLGRSVARMQAKCRGIVVPRDSFRRGMAFIVNLGDSSPVPSMGEFRPAVPDDLCVWRVPSCSVLPTLAWPMIHSEGVRVFAFNAVGTELEREIEALERAVLERDESALSRWEVIFRRSLDRAGIVRYCAETAVTVIPDGPHGNNAGVYSTRLEIPRIVDAFRCVAEQAGVGCVEIPNTGFEYGMLHM